MRRMQRRRSLVLAVATLTVLGAASSSSAAVHRTAPKVVVTGYALAGSAAPSDITRDGRYLATIGVDGVTLTGPGSVGPVSTEAQALRRAAQRAGREAILLVSNYSDALGDFDEARAYAMVSSPANRRSVVEALVRRGSSFDGIQVDLESLAARDRPGLVAFVRELRAALPADRSLSMALMASSTRSGYRDRGYDLPLLHPLLDRLVLMAYDRHGPWSEPGAIGPLGWAKRELTALVRIVPRSKVDLGVATYGYQWGGGATTLSVPQARRIAGAKARWSRSRAEWHAKVGGRTLWWSDRRSVRARERLARSVGVHGVAIWEIGASGRLR